MLMPIIKVWTRPFNQQLSPLTFSMVTSLQSNHWKTDFVANELSKYI